MARGSSTRAWSCLNEEDRERLKDIVDVADELAADLQDVRQAEFLADRRWQRIAERLLEIAGEAANQLDDDVRGRIDADWRALRALRILLAHVYRRVEPDLLWSSATRSLPALAAAVKLALAKGKDSG